MTRARRAAWVLVVMLTAAPARAQQVPTASGPTRATSGETPPPTAADFETARGLVEEGRTLRSAGDRRGALAKFRAAHAVGRTAVTGLELARAHADLGELVESREVGLTVAQLPPVAGETARSAEARVQAARLAEALKPRIAGLIVRVPAGVAVTLDGSAFPDALVGARRKLNPGRHVVSAAGVSRVVDIAEGQTREVDLTTLASGAVATGPARAGASAGASGVDVAAGPEDAAADVLAVPPAGNADPAPKGATRTERGDAREPSDVVFGGGFAVVPHFFFPSQRAVRDPTTAAGAAGAIVEVGTSLTSRATLLARGIVALGDQGAPTILAAAGPAFSLRIGERVWLGIGMLAGTGHAEINGVRYSTDLVFGAGLEASMAVLPRRWGAWIVGVQPSVLFANPRYDNMVLFVPLLLGVRTR